MRLLLALSLLISVEAGACLNTSIGFWPLNGSLVKTCGTEDLAQNGTVSFGSQVCGFNSVGLTAVTDVNFPKAGPLVIAQLQGLQTWTSAGYIYTPSSFVTEPAIFEVYQNVGSNFWCQILASGAIRLGRNNVVSGDSAAGVVATSTCYYFAIVGTPFEYKVSVSPANAIDNNFDVSTGLNATLPATIASSNWGRLALAAGRTFGNGFFYNLGLYNAAYSTFPVPLTNSRRSIFIPDFIYPVPGRSSLLPALFYALLLPRKLEANFSNQRLVQDENVSVYYRWEARTGRLRPTPNPRGTLTKKPVLSATPTATVTTSYTSTPVVTPTPSFTPRQRSPTPVESPTRVR